MSDFDDLFKSRLEGHEVKVPDDMWSRIQSAQAPEDTRKPVFIYWRIGIAVVVLLSITSLATMYYFSSWENSPPVTQEQSASPTLADQLQSSSTDLGSVLVATKDDSAKELAETRTYKPITVNQSNSTVDGLEKNINIDSKSQLERISIGNQISTDGFLNKKLLNVTSVSLEANNSALSEIATLSPRSDLRESGVITEDYIKYSNIPSLVLNNLNDKKIKHLQILPDYDSKCPRFGTSIHGYFSVEAYHSSDFNFRSFMSVNDDFSDYVALREETETSRYSYGNGIKFKWHNRSGLGVGFGVERSVINETFSFIENDAREVKILISIDTLFNTDGSFTTSTDTTRIELQGVRTNRIFNSYTSVDIPLNLSYQIELRKWAVAITGGLNINVLFNQKGRILNFDNKPAWISSNEENELDIYRAQSGVKFDGAITVIYHLTKSIDIMAEPYFRYNPNSFTRENHPLKQYYNTAGIRTGLRYNFGF